MKVVVQIKAEVNRLRVPDYRGIARQPSRPTLPTTARQIDQKLADLRKLLDVYMPLIMLGASERQVFAKSSRPTGTPTSRGAQQGRGLVADQQEAPEATVLIGGDSLKRYGAMLTALDKLTDINVGDPAATRPRRLRR